MRRRLFAISVSILFNLILINSGPCFAQDNTQDDTQQETEGAVMRPRLPSECDDMMIWNFSSAMCEGRAMPGMPMTMIMLQANGFVVGNVSEGPRGRNQVSAPNMVMADVGRSFGDHHFVNLDVMATVERWTYPASGYPLLMQIGEENADGQKYIDAQHPHSSPIMGLTLSDAYSFGPGKNHVKAFVAPRGEATEGPTAFMHRPTGLANPDAPLGHHVGQDVAHITSTVIGSELRVDSHGLEISTFNGTEPEPSKVDLPIASPNSFAARLTEQFNDHFYAMASASYVREPEHHEPDLHHIWRYSASAYVDHFLGAWRVQHAVVYGLINFYDKAGALNSGLYEVWARKERDNLWARFEAVERTPAQLVINAASDRDTGRWVEALTLGYTRTIKDFGSWQISLGGSVTKDFLPQDYQASYGGNPLTARAFLQFGGMQMWMN